MKKGGTLNLRLKNATPAEYNHTGVAVAIYRQVRLRRRRGQGNTIQWPDYKQIRGKANKPH